MKTKFFVIAMVLVVMICGMMTFPVNAEGEVSSETNAEQDFERDEYGLPLRDPKGSPTWYPTSVNDFVEYHDSEAPRVVDVADIFTDEEEEAMCEKIAWVVSETGKDVVIFTDTTTNGYKRETYCYDFYDFCGYGIGDTYDGMCLFVCMDPNNRGWVASATGVVEDMYTESIANELDDELYIYMKGGKYGNGVLDWIGNIYNLYTKGVPFVAEWLPDKNERGTFVRTNNPDSPRVYDSAHVFSDTDKKSLNEKIDSIRNKYGKDVVVHTTRRTYEMSEEEYANAFYEYNGYGVGSNFDGYLLMVLVSDQNKYEVKGFGKGTDKLTNVNLTRLIEQTDFETSNEYYFDGADKFLDNIEHLERTGRVNRSFFSWAGWVAVACIAGFIFAKIALFIAECRMVTVHKAYDADNYLDGYQQVTPVGDTLVKTDENRTRIVYSSSSSYSSSRSSSSSSSRSSYSSHSSGSSGRSHTSSSRNF